MKILRLSLFVILFTLVSNGICAKVFVNTKCPYVKLTYDPALNEKVWKTTDGNFLAKEKDSEPLSNIDEGYYYDEKYKNEYVRKEWDNERGCFVYKTNNGGFLGRDKSGNDLSDKWLKSNSSGSQQNQLANMVNQFYESNQLFYDGMTNDKMPYVSKKAQKKLEEMAGVADDKQQANKEHQQAANNVKATEQTNNKLAQTKQKEAQQQMDKANREAAKAQAELEKAKAELHKLGMHEYDGLLNQASGQLKQAQSVSKRKK